jgi:hypothetical protein
MEVPKVSFEKIVAATIDDVYSKPIPTVDLS